MHLVERLAVYYTLLAVKHCFSRRDTNWADRRPPFEHRRWEDTALVGSLYRVVEAKRMMRKTLHDADKHGPNIVSLTERVMDTTTPMNRILFSVAAVFTEVCLDSIQRPVAPARRCNASGRLWRGASPWSAIIRSALLPHSRWEPFVRPTRVSAVCSASMRLPCGEHSSNSGFLSTAEYRVVPNLDVDENVIWPTQRLHRERSGSDLLRAVR